MFDAALYNAATASTREFLEVHADDARFELVEFLPDDVVEFAVLPFLTGQCLSCHKVLVEHEYNTPLGGAYCLPCMECCRLCEPVTSFGAWREVPGTSQAHGRLVEDLCPNHYNLTHPPDPYWYTKNYVATCAVCRESYIELCDYDWEKGKRGLEKKKFLCKACRIPVTGWPKVFM